MQQINASFVFISAMNIYYNYYDYKHTQKNGMTVSTG